MQKLVGVFLMLLLTAIGLCAQDDKSAPKECNAYKGLVRNVLSTSTLLRNSGEFRTSPVGVNLLRNTAELIKNCPDLDAEQFDVGLVLTKFLIDRNDLTAAGEELKRFPPDIAKSSKTNLGELRLLEAFYQAAKGDSELAIRLAEESFEIALDVRNPESAAEALWLLGSLSEQKGENEKAISYYKRAMNVAELKDIKGDFILESILHIGNVSYQNKDYPNALKYYKLGREKSLEYKISRLLPFAYYHLGKYYFDVEKDSKKALENLQNGVNAVCGSHLENYFITPLILQKIGLVHYQTDNKSQARIYFSKAIEIAERNDLKRMIAPSYKYFKKLKEN